ncbi:MAG: FtsX-like permease family protein [Fibrobacterales bacterium]
MKKFELFLAWRYLGAQRKNLFVSLISLFSMLGVCIGTFALIVALAVANGFEYEVTKQMIGKDAHFEVLSYHNAPVSNIDSIAAIVKKDPHVIAVAPFIATKAGISSKKVNDAIVIFGIDTELSGKVSGLSKQIKFGAYSLDTAATKNGRRLPGIILGSVLADQMRLYLGDKVVLQTFQSPEGLDMGALTPKMKQFIVTGVFETGMYEYDGQLAYISIPAAQHFLQLGEQVSGLQVKTDNEQQSKVYAATAKKALGYPFYTVDWQTKNKTLIKWMATEKVMITAVLCLIILVAAFNIISSLIMLVLEKTREIGILRAMGTSKFSIMKIFVITGTLIGFVGSILGTSIALFFCYGQINYGWITLPPDVYMISKLPVRVMTSDVVIIFIIGNLLCMLATILPAWKASKLDPVGAIRHD